MAITQYEPGLLGPPLAVGRMAMAGSRIRAGERTGKAVYVLHVFKDKLWDMGDKSEPPPAELMTECESDTKDLTESGETDVEGEERPAQVEEGSHDHVERSIPPPPPETEPNEETQIVDDKEEGLNAQGERNHRCRFEAKLNFTIAISDILRTSLVQAIATTASKLPSAAFPLTASQFYTQHILPARPSYIPALSNPSSSSQSQIDIKHSTHKNLAAFLRLAEKDGLLRLKEPKGKKSSGDAQVLSVDATHPEVVSHKPYKTVGEVDAKIARREEKAAVEAAKPQEIRVTELYMPHRQSIRIFESLGKECVVLVSVRPTWLPNLPESL